MNIIMKDRKTGKSTWNRLIRIQRTGITEIDHNVKQKAEIQDSFYEAITSYKLITVPADDHYFISGYVSSKRRKILFDWMMESCKGEVWYYQTRFWFENESDLLLFKLRWQ